MAEQVTDVHIGPGVLGAVFDGDEAGVAILAQPGSMPSAEAVLALAPEGTSLRVVPDGEDAKTLSEVEATVEWLASIGLRRDGLIVGVGGGALTDFAGFVASVYLRGVDVRYVATTLLGAVDAAIGGKTAVNVAGKNLVGSFRHPHRVVIDLEVLAGLDEALLSEGMAEAYKTGLIGDPDLARLLEADGLAADLGEVVARSLTVKTGIVATDFREGGQRAYLNFGHTIGHAVERLSGLGHGASVAIGMVAAAAISAEMTGFTERDRIEAALPGLGLPVVSPPLDRQHVLDQVGLDKKATSDGLRMVLLEAVGHPVVRPVDVATLDAGLEAIGIS